MDDPAKVVIAISFFGSLAFSIRAIANAILRYHEMKFREVRGSPSTDPAIETRLERIEHAVDSIAIEIERISEGQRFTTKLLSDRVTTPR